MKRRKAVDRNSRGWTHIPGEAYKISFGGPNLEDTLGSSHVCSSVPTYGSNTAGWERDIFTGVDFKKGCYKK